MPRVPAARQRLSSINQPGDCEGGLTSREGTEIVNVPKGERAALERILEESFDGWYLRHSKGILRDSETVRAALSSGEAVGLIILKTLGPGVGYIYYIAVATAHRRRGVARSLLNDALERYRIEGVSEVFTSIEAGNAPSEGLFATEGFARTTFAEVTRRFGALRTLNMYRMMVSVPGEVLMHKTIP
jgi:ribosomal protein S18 acetylase RimI-like enzyme